MSDPKPDTTEVNAAKRMFKAVDIQFKKYQPSCKGLRIDLEDFNNQKLEV